MALLSATANFQIGDTKRAHRLLSEARRSGCSRKHIFRMVVAGAYVSLGKAECLARKSDDAAEAHFERARDLVLPSTASLSNNSTQFQGSEFVSAQRDVNKLKRIDSINQVQLGDAWAGNTINTAIFRHHGVISFEGHQYSAFYVDERTLRIVKRCLSDDTLVIYDLSGKYNLKDAHNSISLGFDRDGCIHILYDHHATHLRYRRTIHGSDITTWTDELSMTGSHESQVTYPALICPDQGYPLTLLYRDGVWNKGQARMKVYQEDKRRWLDYPKAVLSGSESKPWTSNPYWNHPVRGADGSLHLTFVWRIHTVGAENRINNVNIDYAKSLDNGVTWHSSKSMPFRLPITQVNSETVRAVSPGSNLINQCSMALDSYGRPHVVYYADDAEGVLQYQHLWFDGRVWQNRVVSRRSKPFVLSGSGTLKLPISRPEIVIDPQDNVYVLTRGDHTDDRLAVTVLVGPDYTYCPGATQILTDYELGKSEPIIDRHRWRSEGILSLLVQRCEQPDGDLGHSAVSTPVSILDFRPSNHGRW